MISAFIENSPAYFQFLAELRKADQLFQQLSDEGILRLQIYANFVIISGGENYWVNSAQKTYVWPFCKKRK